MSIIGVLLLIGSIIGWVTTFFITDDEGKHSCRGWSNLAIISMIVGLIFTCLAVVPRGTVGVEMQFGAVTGEYRTQGLQFKSPIVQLQIVNVQTQKEEVVATAASQDLQDVSTTIALNYHLNPVQAAEVYRDLGLDYIVKVADPAIQETVKQVTARHNAEDLIIHREVIKGEITDELTKRLAPRGIVVEALSITNFQFSSVFTAAIEAKVSALQAVFEAQNKLERVKVEAQMAEAEAKGKASAIVALANGQAEANAVLSKSLTPEIIQYMFIQGIKSTDKVVTVPGNITLTLPSP